MSMSSSTNSLPYSTDKGGYSTHDTLVLLAIGFCATAVAIAIIVLCECLCCRRRRRGSGAVYVAARPFFVRGADGGGGGLSSSAVAALPSFVFHRGLPLPVANGGRGDGSGSGRGWALCAVCLSLVQEGEVVRRLPACMHLFHVSCIDMWLHSHSTCPLCRATVEPDKEAYLKQQAPPV